MDSMSEGQNIITYILYLRTKKFSFIIPINKIDDDEYNRKKYYDLNNMLLNYFVFNKDHIWIVKKINNVWYEID